MKLRLPKAARSSSFAAMKKVRTSRFLSVLPALGMMWLAPSTDLHAEEVPDFTEIDVNTTSPRFDNPVSPRNYRHQISAYYFGSPG